MPHERKIPRDFYFGIKHIQPGVVYNKMIENGASGYILKNSSREELLKAIHAVCEGGIYFSGEVGEALKQCQRSSAVDIPVLSRR